MSAYPSPGLGLMGGPVSNGFNPTMVGVVGPPGPGLYGGMATASSTPNFSFRRT